MADGMQVDQRELESLTEKARMSQMVRLEPAHLGVANILTSCHVPHLIVVCVGADRVVAEEKQWASSRGECVRLYKTRWRRRQPIDEVGQSRQDGGEATDDRIDKFGRGRERREARASTV